MPTKKKTIHLTHTEIQRRLADHLRSRIKPPMVFTEVALDGSWGSMGRMDVVSLQTASHYTKHAIWGYEVKASRSDLLHDIDTRKFEKYLGPLDQFFFVYPVGVASPDEIPDLCGVIVYYPETGVWRTARRAKKLDAYGKGPDMSTFARLLWRAHDMAWQQPKITRLERMERFEKETKLKYSLSRKAQAIIDEADRLRSSLQIEIEAKREQLAREKKALEGAPEVMRALATILRYAGQTVNMDRYSMTGQDEARSAIIDMAAELEQRVQEARRAST